MVVGLPKQKRDPTLLSKSSIKKRATERQEGKGSLCVQRTYFPGYLHSCYLVDISQGRSHSHSEDEEKRLGTLPRLTLIKWQRQDQISDFPF